MAYNYLDIAFAPHGGYWRQMRKICTLELLSLKNVRTFSSIREEEAFDLVESITSSFFSPIDLTQKVFSYANNIICRSAFGKRFKNHEELIQLTIELTDSAGGFDVADLFPSIKILQNISGLKSKLMKLHYKIDQILNSIIEEHKERLANTVKFNGQSSEEDLIDVLLRLKETGDLEFPITINSMKAIILVSRLLLFY